MSDSATPWTIAHQALLFMGFSRQEYWNGLPFPSKGDLPNAGIKPRSPALQGDSLLSKPPGKAIHIYDPYITWDTHVPKHCFSYRLLYNSLPCHFSVSQNLLKLMSIELMMPSNHLLLCCLLLLLPSIFPGIRVFSNESTLCNRQPNYWSFSFSMSCSIEYSGLISLRID